jgi:hypothetical protein
MFEQALKAIARLPDAQRPLLMERLDAVCRISQNIGYGVDDAMGDLLAEYDNIQRRRRRSASVQLPKFSVALTATASAARLTPDADLLR